MKILNTLILIFLITGTLNPASIGETTDGPSSFNNFRGFRWGESKQKVKEEETAYFLQENNNGLLYEDQLFQRRFDTAYFFHENKLYRGVYSLQEPFKSQSGSYLSDNKNYFILYKNIVEDVEEKYGKPTKEIPLPSLGTVNVNEFLEQVEKGKKTVISKWELEDVLITTAIKGSKGKIKVLKIYDYKPLIEEIGKSKNKTQKIGAEVRSNT